MKHGKWYITDLVIHKDVFIDAFKDLFIEDLKESNKRFVEKYIGDEIDGMKVRLDPEKVGSLMEIPIYVGNARMTIDIRNRWITLNGITYDVVRIIWDKPERWPEAIKQVLQFK